MQIKETMQRYGYSPTSLAKKMGVYASTVIRLTEGNPTVDKLDELARWIGCSRWEFFKDEIEAAGYRLTAGPEPQPAAAPASQYADKMGAAHEVSTEGKRIPDDLPFSHLDGGQQPTATMQQAVICPHCGHALVMNIASYEKK